MATPALAPPNGTSTTAHLYVIRAANAFTSYSSTTGLNLIPVKFGINIILEGSLVVASEIAKVIKLTIHVPTTVVGTLIVDFITVALYGKHLHGDDHYCQIKVYI